MRTTSLGVRRFLTKACYISLPFEVHVTTWVLQSLIEGSFNFLPKKNWSPPPCHDQRWANHDSWGWVCWPGQCCNLQCSKLSCWWWWLFCSSPQLKKFKPMWARPMIYWETPILLNILYDTTWAWQQKQLNWHVKWFYQMPTPFMDSSRIPTIIPLSTSLKTCSTAGPCQGFRPLQSPNGAKWNWPQPNPKLHFECIRNLQVLSMP